MGPNGSGKSTLVLRAVAGARATRSPAAARRSTAQDLLALEPEERAAAGVFLAFQYPVELPGVGNANFLRTALNAQRAGARRGRAGRGAVPEAGARRS
jgi:Fe-S cluster assembly ATP-binding protein